MANGGDPFSTSTMRNALRDHRFAAAREPIAEENPAVPPPPRSTAPRETNLTEENQSLLNSFRPAALTRQETETRSQSLFNLMTTSSEEGEAQFDEVISRLEGNELLSMASLLTSDFYYFVDIARYKNGSKNLQKLLGISDDVDNYFAAFILRWLFHLMIDKDASCVAIRGMRAFSQEKKMVMYVNITLFAIYLASDRYGCIALNEFITDLDDVYCKTQLLDIVAWNAIWLSNDAYGNFVVQHVLKLNNRRCTHNVAVVLQGHCVALSFKKYGSYVVEKLLDAEESMVMVVSELLVCEVDRLMWLARSKFGSFVMKKALRVTQEMSRTDLYMGLVDKLKPFRLLLLRAHGRNIAAILDSI